jgi:hypothetical protein
VTLSGGTQRKKLRLLPRAPGDTMPLDPLIADAVRKAGLDPAKFTAAPMEEGETNAAVGAFGAPGVHIEHTFLFPSLDGSFSAMEKLLGGGIGARIRKDGDGWLVSFDAAADPGVGDAAGHQRFVEVASALGAQDRGFTRMTVNINTRVANRTSEG